MQRLPYQRATLAVDGERVKCGTCGCVLGFRAVSHAWLDDAGQRHQSPYYGVTLKPGFHLYDNEIFRMTPRAQARLDGRSPWSPYPTYRQGERNLKGETVTGSLSVFDLPAAGVAYVVCPRCGKRSELDPVTLRLEDWTPPSADVAVSLPPD